MAKLITKHRRGTTDEWDKSTVVLEEGELVIEECTDGQAKIKVGDGVHTFKELDYITSAVETDIATLEARVSSHISFNEGEDFFGEGTVESEIVDARIARNGTRHKLVGDHIREVDNNVTALRGSLSNFINAEAVDGLFYQDSLLYLTANGKVLEDSVVKIVSGGGGGGGSNSSLTIGYITTTPVVATLSDRVDLYYTFSGVDSSGDEITEGTATWKVDGRVVHTEYISSGTNHYDLTEHLPVGNSKVLLTVSDAVNNFVTKAWTVRVEDLRVESSFNDKVYYPLRDISFEYTPYGSQELEKEIHFILDGEPLGVVKTFASGVPQGYTLPAQPHGSHLLEVYATATINNLVKKTDSIFKDIIWYENDISNAPVIGVSEQNIIAAQYDTVNLDYVVYDPSTDTPEVVIRVDGDVVSTPKLEQPEATYTFRATSSGEHTITISCGSTIKVVTANITPLDIKLEPVTAGLAFDFNPVGRTNRDDSKYWSDRGVSMTFSDNFDWVNGGYDNYDENGDQYFCIKAGTFATIDYELFKGDPKKSGKEFKIIFKTTNIRKRDTSFLSCISDGIGLDMRVENATVYNSGGSLRSDYCEDTIIEYEFNINKADNMMIVMSYEDGAPSKPCEYTETTSFDQLTPKPIKIGSDDCDVHIYRIKAYSTSLSDIGIKNNFIADARNSNEIIDRYKRNQIYTDGRLISTSASGGFNVDALMKAAPDLRYIFLEVPQFTNDKDNKIDDCTVYFRYPAGTRPQDNWTCTGMRHRGQGTSSNLYGYAGRNIDLCMDRKTSVFTWEDENGETVESSTITLTDTSIPTNYLNIKVNIASSENANNAEMARRYNTYQPFIRYARKKDSRVKDTMEFYNCVVFIRETSTDLSSTPHREFNDTDWHFYAIGNVGDSKKTDYTRVNNAKDPKEHVVEIMDADVDLARFPTGKDNYAVCPVDEWCEGNTAYDILHSTDYVYDDEGEFESFANGSYEFRYEMDGLTDTQRETNINIWRNLYKFIVTSTDEEFHTKLKDYFVVDSALYYYLFTERYTMVDNRAKNSFWHYGKVYISNEEAATLGDEASYYIIDNDAAAINEGYRYDLTFGYDFDTCLGIDNTGDYVFSYGKEDTDSYDGLGSKEVFRASESTFFCRLRDLFGAELQSLFKDREEKNAWSSTSLINQWDSSQIKFPEELWRLDYERKYYRTYLGLSIDNSIPKGIDKTFLIGKFFGRKKYARRAFETNQEIYFATKYFGNTALSDVLWFRCNSYGGDDPSLKHNYSLTLTPYSNMYLCVKYGSTGSPQHSSIDGKPTRILAGQSYAFNNTSDEMDFVYIYAAGWIQEIGDLSRCYIDDNNFSTGTRLQKLQLGSSDTGYDNPFMERVKVDSNPLLEYLDIRNISGINTNIDLRSCVNLVTLYAEGTNASEATFADGGNIETAHLPAVGALNMKNLLHLTDFTIGFKNLTTILSENCNTIDLINIIKNSPNLSRVRITGIDWHMETTSILNRISNMFGLDNNGYDCDNAVLIGRAFIDDLNGEDYSNLTNTFKDLELSFSSLKSNVYFMDEEDNILGVSPVLNPEVAGTKVDPDGVSLKVIPDYSVPKEPTMQFVYTHKGWTRIKGSEDEDTGVFSNILGDRKVYPRYVTTVRDHRVRFFTGSKLIYEDYLPYGSTIVYDYNKASQNTDRTIVREDGTPVKQLTGAPDMYIFTTFMPSDVPILLDSTDFYAEFVLSLDGLVSASLTEFEYDVDNTNKTLSLNRYVAVPNDEENDSDSMTYVPETYTVYDGDTPLGEYRVTSVGGFDPTDPSGKVVISVEFIGLPDSIETIQAGAFKNCTKLMNAYIGPNVTTIGSNAFGNCTSLEEVEYRAKKLTTEIAFTANSPFRDSVSDNGFSLIIGNEVEELPAYLFSRNAHNKKSINGIKWELTDGHTKCASIKTSSLRYSIPEEFNLPEGVTTIGDTALEGDNFHTEITCDKQPDDTNNVVSIPSTITTIGDGAFNNWSELTKIHLNGGIEKLNGAIAKNCPKLKELEIDSGSRYVISGNSIVDSATRTLIQGCSGSVVMGGQNGIVAIGKDAFMGTSIKSPATPTDLLPESLTTLGVTAFSHCDGLTEVVIPSGVTTIPSQCFEYCSNLSTITFPEKLTSFNTYVFWYCTSLNNVKIPSGVTKLTGGLFNKCSSLDTIELTNNIKSIEVYSFSGTAFTDFTLPDSVETLESHAFEKCLNLKTFTFGRGIKTIGGNEVNTVVSYAPFSGCTALTTINCPFSPDSELAQMAPWGVPNKVDVVYNYGADNQVVVTYNN